MSTRPEDIQDKPKQTADAVDHILKDAVNAGEMLLTYAAEQECDLDENLVQTIVRSKHTLTARALKENEESEFWVAYRKLCILTAPVSRESLEATDVKVRSSRFFTRDVSEVGKVVFRYRVVAIISILILLLSQIYWVFLSTLVNDSKRIDNELIIIENAAFDAKYKYISDKVANPQDQTMVPETQKKLAYRESPKYIDLLHQWNANLLLLTKIDLLSKAFKDSIDKAATKRKLYFDEFERAVQIQTGTVTLNIMSLYILPILYGLVGACAYILRTISQQIKTRTFTRASKIRLQLRMVLGALAGFSIAWFVGGEGQASTVANVTPFALAFLGGYSVELLFSAMDTFVEAFTRKRSSE